LGMAKTSMDAIEQLTRRSARRNRQQGMVAFWLMPFWGLAGLMFSLINHLHTFASPAPLVNALNRRSLLGNAPAGWAATPLPPSVSSETRYRVRSLRNRSIGQLLLLLEIRLPGKKSPDPDFSSKAQGRWCA